ncbi:hermansky-Pudlak syndrome 1-like protein [Plakobranchus ocellatus]|uniref:Hermansky-Pudlak syndrome 1-like protein n=1 Tax=Plakobranchus ocellatus TaxID=259542 RepID=A0AAV4B7E7_9GAST|nr:hermansky-Pudlak syndrome 1-like protein [Plakobranchus ocellatus]
MKCFLVVNQLNDPCFIDYDEPFAAYLTQKAKEKGLLEDDCSENEIDPNLVMQLFSPLVLSQWLLVDQTKEPCSSVSCQNGFCFVFHHLDDLLFICINGDGTESETFLHKKIHVFMTMMRFMFGPVNEVMAQSHAYTKRAKWEFLRQMMRNWAEMADSEQSFLVEAVERMHVNQVMNEKCVEILKKSVKHMQTARETTTQHAILLAKSKLLALYSNRNANELLAKDLLSLMILSKTLHPSTDTLEDLFSKNYTGSKASSAPVNENADWGDEEYHSAPNTPKSRSPALSSVPEVEPNTEIITTEMLSKGLLDSLSAQSNSETETIKNGQSSDADFQSQKEGQEGVPSLIQMYRQKYPDSHFEKPLSETQNHPEVKPTVLCENTKKECIGESSSLGKLSSKSGTDSSQTVESIPQSEAQKSNRKGNLTQSNNLNPLKGKPDVTADVYKDAVGQERIKTTTCGTNQSDSSNFIASGHSHNVDQKPSLDQDESSKFCSPALPQGSPGINSLSTFGEASRSSSVLSNVSAGYPALSPQLDENSDYRSFPESPASELSRSVSARNNLSPTQLQRNFTETQSLSLSSSIKPNIRIAASPQLQERHNANISRTESSTQTFESVSTMVSNRSSSDIYVPQTVFLETSTCLYSPYSVDVLQVLPGLTLVLLSEVPHRVLADILYQVIHNIQDLLYGRRIKLPRSRSLNVYDIISSLLSKLYNSLKRSKGRIRALVSEINSRWEKENLKQKLLDYLEKDSRAVIPPELESAMNELYKKLKELFSHMFLTPVLYSSHVYEAIAQLKAVINAELMDYHGYLNVKVQRNITMTSYIDDFPGLVHFIFVDRHFHQMTAPSFNISLREGESMDATSYLKKKIWTMHQYVMKKLMEGYTTVMIKDGDFYFSYFLWFEDYTGNPLPVQEGLRPTNKHCIPGTLSESFYL